MNLEDLWLETRPQNVPGTGPELPNWKRKAAIPCDEFTRLPDVLTVLQAVAAVAAASRRSGHKPRTENSLRK